MLGPEHPETLVTCYDLALCLKDQNKKEEAKVFAKRAAEGARKGGTARVGTGGPRLRPSRATAAGAARRGGLGASPPISGVPAKWARAERAGFGRR